MQYSDSFVLYTKELAAHRYDPITIEEERVLFIKYKEGSNIAFQKIINSNLRFVPFLLKKNFIVPEDVDMMDVIQEGNLGLIEGVKRFDGTKYDCRIYSYCSYWVYFYINVYLNGKKKSRNFFFSYDSVEEGEKENLVVEDADVSIQYVLSEAKRDIVAQVFEVLSDREKAILINYFGLQPPYIPKTLQEIGSMFHIHLERVRQLKDKSLLKLQQTFVHTF